MLSFSTSTHNYLKMVSSAADRQQAVLFNQSGNSGGISFEGGTRGNYIGFTVNGVEGLQVTGTSATFAGTVKSTGNNAGVLTQFRLDNVAGSDNSGTKIAFASGSTDVCGIQQKRTASGSHSLTLQTYSFGNVDALTLAPAGDATFAGKVLSAAGTAAGPTLTFSGDSDTGFYNAGGNQVAATAAGAQVWNTTSNGLAMALGKDIYVGNAYVAGAPTATGYVTIKDSNGVTYKVLVST